MKGDFTSGSYPRNLDLFHLKKCMIRIRICNSPLWQPKTGMMRAWNRQRRGRTRAWRTSGRTTGRTGPPPARIGAAERGRRQGWKKPGFLKKNQPIGFFGFFGVFWVFFGFFLYICPEERVFMFFLVSRILLGASRLKIIISITN